MHAEQRKSQVAEVIRRNEIATQEQLVALLAAEGVETTQATLSRDLRDLGARKQDGIYRLGFGQGSSPSRRRQLSNRMAELVESAQATGPLVVLTTRQGMAQAVALELADAGLPEVLGTIAGVDTVFVATTTPGRARALGRTLTDRR